MIAALRYELVRILTVRSTWIMLALAPLLAGGIGYLASSPSMTYTESGDIVEVGPGDWYGAFGFPLTLTAVLAAVIASQAIGQEYRFGLIRLSLTAFPRRLTLLSAKATIVVVAAGAVALLSYVGSFVAVSLRGYPTPPESVLAPDSTYFLRGLVYVVLFALAAFALAGVTRQTAIGIAIPIVSGLIVEQLLSAVLFDKAEWLVRILPFSGGARWNASPDQGGFDIERYTGWSAIVLFLVWVVMLLAVQTTLFLRRDA